VGGEVRILQGGNVIATAVTDAFGRYVMHNLPAGAYRVEVRFFWDMRARPRICQLGDGSV